MTAKKIGVALVVFGALILGGSITALTSSPSATADDTTPTVVHGKAGRVKIAKNGTKTQLDSRSITLTVSQTTNLRGRQMIDVTWSGAHPTGGVVADPNSSDAALEEYPLVLLECRGTATTISPSTCWTQTSSERYVNDSQEYPAWRSDVYESAADRKVNVGGPAKRPGACGSSFGSERWVPFVAADGTKYWGGAGGCAGMAPEATDVSSGLPSNTTYGITGSDGSGSTKFAVWSEDDNASLGCSSTVPCSLVAVPIEGISCDPYGTKLSASARPASYDVSDAVAACEGADVYRPGETIDTGKISNYSVTGRYWWSASNWQNRLTVPLSFAVSPSECSVVNNLTPLQTYGSALMEEISAAWEPTFCTSDSYTPFVNVQTSDSSARALLSTGNISVAFGTQPVAAESTDDDSADADGPPIVQAPIAMTGFAIGYSIDGADQQPYTSLKLNARLVAKLLTESYPATQYVQENHPGLDKNPLNITLDPEFQALNPGIPQSQVLDVASTIITLSSDTDMLWALTSWIDDDPEARAFLDGTPDPWGMVVNDSYKSIELPVTSWPLLDDWQLPADSTAFANNLCYSRSPAPFLALIANPTALVSTVTQDIQFGESNVGTACVNPDPTDVSTLRLRTEGRQAPGHRFVIGITPLTAAPRYSFSAAALQTTSDVSPSAKFTDAAGRTFVSPNDDGLRAAAKLLVADPTTGTWPFPYDALHTPAGSAAYPGAMVVYADVPVSGVSPGTAELAAELLSYAATTGQTPGTANGQLPPGAIPLTSENGLGDLSGYTLCAANAVKAQTGTVPTLDQTSGCQPIVPSKRPPAPSDGSSVPPVTPVTPPVIIPPVDTSVPPTDVVPPVDTSAPPTPVVAAPSLTASSYSYVGAATLPIAAVSGALVLLAGLVLMFPGWRRGKH